MTQITINKSRKKKGQKSKAPRKLPKSLVSKMNNLILKQLEVKQWQFGISNIKLTDYANSSQFPNRNVMSLGPDTTTPISQGTGNSDRIGNRVRIKRATLKLMLYPNHYDATENPIPQPHDVRVIIAHSKATPTALIVSSTFFEDNNGTVSPQDGIDDQILSVNKDIYVVNKDFRVKVGHQGYGGTANVAETQFYTNNDYKLNQLKVMDVTKCFPVNMEWNDTSPIPTSFMPNLIMLVSPADGTDSDASTYPVRFAAEITILYTDA